MNIRKFKKAEFEEENVFWVTMSDLLLGLTMVFMTLFVLTMTGFTQQKNSAAGCSKRRGKKN